MSAIFAKGVNIANINELAKTFAKSVLIDTSVSVACKGSKSVAVQTNNQEVCLWLMLLQGHILLDVV